MRKENMRSNGLLFLAAIIWGIAFVAQSDAMNYVGALTFNGGRFILGGAVLLPLVWYNQHKLGKAGRAAQRKPILLGALLCGTALAIATALQQYGLIETSAGKAGFLTALYVVLVPMIGVLFRKKVPFTVWIGAVVAVIGMYLLCINESFSLATSDILILLCAVAFSIQITLVSHFSPQVDGVTLSCLAFFVAGIENLIPALFIESNHIPSLMAAWLPLLYTGILSSGVAYTLQMLGQKHAHPAIASLIMSLESVFAALAGWLILGDMMTSRELWGSVLMFAAVILAQIPVKSQQRT